MLIKMAAGPEGSTVDFKKFTREEGRGKKGLGGKRWKFVGCGFVFVGLFLQLYLSFFFCLNRFLKIIQWRANIESQHEECLSPYNNNYYLNGVFYYYYRIKMVRFVMLSVKTLEEISDSHTHTCRHTIIVSFNYTKFSFNYSSGHHLIKLGFHWR